MTNLYADWLYHRLIAPRAQADPDALRRALFLVTAGLSKIDDDQPAKTLFRAKIASLEFVQSLVARESSLVQTLELPLQKMRWLSATATAETTKYVEAVVAAFRGQVGVAIEDTSGKQYDVSLVSLRTASPPFTTVFISRPDEHGTFANDFRLPFLTLIGTAIAERLDVDRAHLDMSPAERSTLAELLAKQNPESRLRLFDEILRDRYGVFLSRVATYFGKGETYIEVLRPPQVDETIRFIGGEHNRVLTLTERLPLDEVFGRLSALPIALPENLIDSYAKCEAAQRRKTRRHLQAEAHSIFPAMHYLRLLLFEAASAAKRERVLRRFFGRFVIAADFQSFSDYARWLYVEIERRPATSNSVYAKLLSTWTTASYVTSLANKTGFTGKEAFEVLDSHGQPETLFMHHEVSANSLSPIQMGPIEVAIRVLAEIFRGHEDLRDGLSNIYETSVFRSDSPWPIHIDLYPAFSRVADSVESIFSHPIEDVLESLLGDKFSEEIRDSFTEAYALRAASQEVALEPTWWHFLRRRTLSGEVPTPIRTALFADMNIGPKPSLLASDDRAWVARMMTFSQSLSHDWPTDTDSFLEECLLYAESTPAGEFLGTALLRAMSLRNAHLADRGERLRGVERSLERLIQSTNAGIRGSAWRAALLLRNRLNATEVSSNLSRVILLGRKFA